MVQPQFHLISQNLVESLFEVVILLSCRWFTGLWQWLHSTEACLWGLWALGTSVVSSKVGQFDPKLCILCAKYTLVSVWKCFGESLGETSCPQLDLVIGLLWVTEWTSMSMTSASIWKSWISSGTPYLSALLGSTSAEVSICELWLASIKSLGVRVDAVEVVVKRATATTFLHQDETQNSCVGLC